MLSSGNIVLRAVEPKDIGILQKWENDTSIWKISQTLAPFSEETLRQYINTAQDIHIHSQIRFIIDYNKISIGTIDLFDYDPVNLRAGVGVMIESTFRGKGYAKVALELIVNYCKQILFLRQIYCNITEDNVPSIRLFEGLGFVRSGMKKDWIRIAEGYQSVGFYQLILDGT
jgi:diamine N-acetyltransferase